MWLRSIQNVSYAHKRGTEKIIAAFVVSSCPLCTNPNRTFAQTALLDIYSAALEVTGDTPGTATSVVRAYASLLANEPDDSSPPLSAEETEFYQVGQIHLRRNVLWRFGRCQRCEAAHGRQQLYHRAEMMIKFANLVCGGHSLRGIHVGAVRRIFN